MRVRFLAAHLRQNRRVAGGGHRRDRPTFAFVRASFSFGGHVQRRTTRDLSLRRRASLLRALPAERPLLAGAARRAVRCGSRVRRGADCPFRRLPSPYGGTPAIRDDRLWRALLDLSSPPRPPDLPPGLMKLPDGREAVSAGGRALSAAQRAAQAERRSARAL